VASGGLGNCHWTGSAAAQANAKLALAALEHADDDGLQPDRYHLGEIDLRHRAETAETAAEYAKNWRRLVWKVAKSS